MCQSASRVKLILGLSSTSKVEDLWTTRLGTAYRQRIPFSWIVVALGAMQNSSHLISSVEPCRDRRLMSCGIFPRPLMILFVLGKKRLEAVANLSQFPENRKKLNCDYEQQKLGNHFLASSGKK